MSEQLQLWAGEFGDQYHERNTLINRLYFWDKVLGEQADGVHSVLEPGAGKGDNLLSLDRVLPFCRRFTGIEVNKSACLQMQAQGLLAINGSFPDIALDNRYDLVLTRGFLIHVPPNILDRTLDKIYLLSNRYIAVAEYYSPRRRRVSYRGHRNAMWTGDYAGMLMKAHPDLELLNCGFEYEDGITWFLLEKGAV